MRTFILENSGISSGPDYRFSGENQLVRWPQENGFRLGMAGAWNLLFRVGAHPRIIEESNLHSPEEGDVLYIAADASFSPQTERAIQKWLASGGKVLASGYPEAWKFALPNNSSIQNSKLNCPYAALAWLYEDGKPELTTPPGWTFLRIKKKESNSLEFIGNLVSISGERQTPIRALVKPLEDAPAIIRSENFVYLNGNPFSALQSWLQGQENLEPWLSWRHRIFWLDEYAAFLYKTLRDIKFLPEGGNDLSQLSETTVVFRHDLDYSRDTTYLDMETQANLSGVHAILDDQNTNYWMDTLSSTHGHESAFHYNTASYSRWLEAARNKLLNLSKRPYRPNKKAIKGKGLLNQVRWAKKKGIGIKTLHRHASFILYPELVDALDTVYKNEEEVLGSSSYFRAQVLRWGIDRADGLRGNFGDAPAPQFPYWFPFRLAHAGFGGKLLRGWENTCVMEAEPGLVEQMLDYNAPGLKQRVFILNYHPAHANSSTFNKNGGANWLRGIIELCAQRGVDVRTLSEVYKSLNTYLKSPLAK
jgi:hypothetical protein